MAKLSHKTLKVCLMCMSTPYWNFALIKMAYIQQLNNFLYLNCNFSCVGKMTVFWLKYLYLYRKISKLYEYLTK